jgi:phosphate-selective porin OprO/OprP
MRVPHAASLTAAIALCVLVGGVALPAEARAQSEESENAPARGEFEPAPLPPASFMVPEVPESVVDKTQVRAKGFTLKLGLVLIADYSAFAQDATSVSQVGEQRDQWDDRAARRMLRGNVGKVNYLAAGEYKGFETDPLQTWQVTDVSLTLPIGGPETKLTVGKTKETFAYEMVGDAANLPAQERVLNPFFVSRNIGAKITRVLGREHRMTVSAGVFNDWWATDDDFSDSGTNVTVRATGLVWDRLDGKHYMHVGLAGRYAGADNGTMRYRARPESNVTDYYLDTGSLAGDHAQHVGIEALLNEGPFSVLGEYTHAWVDSPSSGHPEFDGYYVAASWVLTGENRPYDRTVGYARRVMPTRRWGAPEVVLRFSHLDLDDGVVQGGSFDKTYLGVNWWATRRWKFGMGWGHTWLDRLGATGRTDSFLTRFQWVY